MRWSAPAPGTRVAPSPEWGTQMRRSAPATRAQAPRRALADSRSSRGLRCARFTPALALAPRTPRLRFGPAFLRGPPLRRAERKGRRGGVGVLRDRERAAGSWRGFAVAAVDVGLRCEPGEAEGRSTRPDCGLENGVQKSWVAQHLRGGSQCERGIPVPGFSVHKMAVSELRIPGPGFCVRSVCLLKGELRCAGPRRLRARKPRAERSRSPQERRGCASAPLCCGGLRCAAQIGRGAGLVWGFFEIESGRLDRGRGSPSRRLTWACAASKARQKGDRRVLTRARKRRPDVSGGSALARGLGVRTENPGTGIFCSQSGGFRTANPGTGIFRSHARRVETRDSLALRSPRFVPPARESSLATSTWAGSGRSALSHVASSCGVWVLELVGARACEWPARSGASQSPGPGAPRYPRCSLVP